MLFVSKSPAYFHTQWNAFDATQIGYLSISCVHKLHSIFCCCGCNGHRHYYRIVCNAQCADVINDLKMVRWTFQRYKRIPRLSYLSTLYYIKTHSSYEQQKTHTIFSWKLVRYKMEIMIRSMRFMNKKGFLLFGLAHFLLNAVNSGNLSLFHLSLMEKMWLSKQKLSA